MEIDTLEGQTAPIPDETPEAVNTSQPEEAVIESANDESQDGDISQTTEAPANADDAQEKESRNARRRRLKAEQAAAEAAEREDLRKRLERAEAKLKTYADPDPNDPKYTYGDSDPRYQAELAAVTMRRQLAEESKADLASQQAAIEERRKAENLRRVAEMGQEATTVYSDFKPKVAVADAIVAQSGEGLQQAMNVAIFQDNGVTNGADLAYYLGCNPEVLQSLKHLDMQSALYQLGQIGAGLSRPQPKKTSTAPAPISPVKAGGIPVKDPAQMSMTEYRAARQAGHI